jgi:serine/threonine protein kinase
MSASEDRLTFSARAAALGTEPDLDDPRLVRAVQEYLKAMETGRHPNRDDFLARYAPIAEPLAECLEGLELVHTFGQRLDHPHAEPSTAMPGVLGSINPTVPLGDFRLVREIGRGGMGIVYEAEQLSLGRRIALKVLPFAMTLDPRQLQRFKNEARAAAHLHHSNIVPIYSVGSERGIHFYAMEYIEGQPLTKLINELRQTADREDKDTRRQGAKETRTLRAEEATAPVGGRCNETRNDDTLLVPLSPCLLVSFFETVARLGVQAAEALEHAHERGVIHRDIKPGNLLVEENGHLWITDFGLAQFQNSDAALTMTGDLVGTLRYMSPEQALAQRGLVDHRTDVYSLGVTLYEVLTLEPSFDGRDRNELLRQIAFEEPCSPRQRNEKIPVDLETIVLKAIAKPVEERYATAQELADDLRRFLDHKPILARRPTCLERATKWARRHRGVVRAGIVLLLVAAVGFAVSTVLIWQEQARAKAAYEAEARQRARADENFHQARRMLDFFTQVSAVELADKPEVQVSRRKLLEAALGYYQRFIERHRDDPTIQGNLASSYLRVSTILNEMGNPDDALANLEQAFRLQERVVCAHPGNSEHWRKLFTMDQHLGWLRDRNQFLLLTYTSIQEELSLSPDQAGKVRNLAQQRRAAFNDHPCFNPADFHARLAEFAGQEKAVVQALKPEQRRRLNQITWQQARSAAFSNPEVIKALRLTAQQKDQIRAIQKVAYSPKPAPGHRFHAHRPEAKKKTESSEISTLDRILKVLTAEQKEIWKGLLGTPFKGALHLGYRQSTEFGPPRYPKKS